MQKEVYTEHQAEQFLKKYLPVAKSQLVKSSKEIKLPLPLVLKIISADALHKSEVKGVRVVHTKEELTTQFDDLISISKKKGLKLQGILAQEFCEGQELIIGLNKDPVFGHVIVFGVGGIFTEVLKDTSTRKCPITRADALEMISELRAKDLFSGVRGVKISPDMIANILVKVSQIPLKNKRIKELDINPFIASGSTGKVADARIIFE